MGRSGYQDDCDNWDLIRWRGRVSSAIRGKRGQSFLLDLIAALDAMPVKELIRNELVFQGDVCALGAVGKYRGIEKIEEYDPEDHDGLSGAFNIASCLVQEVEFINDESYLGFDVNQNENRWKSVRKWAEENLIKP